MAEHPIRGLMDVTLEKIKQMVDSNTVVGSPINLPDGTTILPVSKITFGFVPGGSDLPNKTAKVLFGGGSSAGVTVSPVGFLVIQPGANVRMIQHTDTSNNIDRALSLMPEMFDKITGLIKKDKPEPPTGETE